MGEGGYGIWRQPDLSWRAGLLGVAATAPVWPLAGMATLAVQESWSRALGVERPFAALAARIRRWLSPADAATASRRAVWTGAVLGGVGLWAVASVAAGSNMAHHVRTPTFLVALILAVSSALALVVAMAVPLLAGTLGWAVQLSLRKKPALTRFATPGTALGGAGVLVLTGLTAAWLRSRGVMVHLPWDLAAGAACGLALSWAVSHAIVGAVGAGRSALALMVIVLPCSWAGQSSDLARSHFVLSPNLTSASQQLLAFAVAKTRDPDADLAEEEAAGTEQSGEPRRVQPRPPGLHRRPHIVLITTDSLSFSHTTLGGYRRDTAPRLAQWASRATSFSTAFSLSAATRTAFPGLLAGIFNAQARLKPDRTPPFPYAEDMATMAQLLKQVGYRTVHIPGGQFFLNGGRGWHTVGFDVVDDVCIRAKDPIHTAPEVTDAALRYIDGQPGDQPLFLWVHYFDHHLPFELSGEIRPFDEGREQEDIYDAELRFADHHWGRLLEHVEQAWPAERYLTIFTSDHGESFDANHLEKHHSGSILTSVLHVPLLIQAPKGRGSTVNGLVSHADVLPTIADVIGLEPSDRWVGSSLLTVLFDGAPVERTLQYSLRFAPELHQSQRGGFLEIGVRTHDHYLIHDVVRGSARLVDWRHDPLERTDIAAQYPDEYRRLSGLARRKLSWIKARECGLRYPACP